MTNQEAEPLAFEVHVKRWRQDANGEWQTPRVVMAQFRGVTDKNMEQFRQPGKQVVLYPPQFKTGEVMAPFEKVRK